MKFKRVVLIVLDGCGVGELPDAHNYKDCGASTLSNCAEVTGGLQMPQSQELGLGNIVPIKGVEPNDKPLAHYGKMTEQSVGKDSTTGHWEIAGVITEKPLPTFPNGFPPHLIEQLEKRANIKTIGNCTASGTEIINQLGAHHLKTKDVILYTSADSVLQLAAHEDIYSVEQLYDICRIAREIFKDEYAVGRVIARPFAGEAGNFYRTPKRKDFSLPPISKSILEYVIENNFKTLAIGKINDLFCGVGISKHLKTNSNDIGLQEINNAIIENNNFSLLFANLVEFDELWGHRRTPYQFAESLHQFDNKLKLIINNLRDSDLLILTADHGCDPTFSKHTDHTREYVPLLVYHKNITAGKNLGTRNSFADIAKTIADIFNIENNLPGKSFKQEF